MLNLSCDNVDMSFWFAHKMGLVASLGGFGRWKQMMNDDRFQVWVWCDGEAEWMLSGAREYNSLSVSPHNEPIKIGLAEDILSQNINLSHSSESAALLPHVDAVLCKNWKYFSKEKLIFMIAAQDTGPGLRSMQWRHLAIDTSRK